MVSGDRIQIDIVPVISQQGQQNMIRFTGAATSVVVSKGQWVTIGGTREETNEVVREILSGGGTQKDSDLSMSLMVE